MHRIYSEEYMEDKADAIRYACNLPASQKMTPPQMADVLLQYASDPGLVYTVNNYILGKTGVAAPSVRLLHPSFGQHQVGNIDFDIFNKLMITFNISGCSIIRNQTYSIEDLNNGICTGNSEDSDAANNPLRALLFTRPIHQCPNTGDTTWRRNKYSIVDVYQSSTQGVVIAFSKFQRIVDSDYTSSIGCKVEHIIEHAENKDVSIILYKNQPNDYTVLVNGEFAFNENRAASDTLPSTASSYYIPSDEVGIIAICDINYGAYNSSGYSEDVHEPYVYGDSDRYGRYPFYWNSRFDVDYNNVTIKYIK